MTTASTALTETLPEPGRAWDLILQRFGFTAAVFLVPVVFVLVPFASFLVTSLGYVQGPNIVPGLNVSNYTRIVSDETVRSVIGRTLLLSVGAAVICTALAFPVAQLIWLLKGRRRYLVMTVFAIPLLMSYVVKLYSMRNILGNNGVINRFLVGSGIVDAPLPLFSLNLYGVLLAFISMLLPFAIFPIFLSLEQLPRQLIEAAGDLGAGRVRTFLTVILPLSLPGIAVSLSFTFVLTLGDFITPELVGGPSGFTLGRIIFSQFGLSFNWPFGAALSVFLMAMVSLFLALMSRLRAKQGAGR